MNTHSRFIYGSLIFPLLVSGLSSCHKFNGGVSEAVTECAGSTHFCRFDDYSSQYPYDIYSKEYFSTPEWKWYRLSGNELINVTVQDMHAGACTTYEDIYAESICPLPGGGMYLSDPHHCYYLSPSGTLTPSNDQWSYSGLEGDEYWSGAAFVSDEGYYTLAYSDGDAIRITVRYPSMTIAEMVTLPNVPPGDCLAAYKENGKYHVLLCGSLIGNPFARHYSFYQSGSSIIVDSDELQLPDETKGKHWRNFKRDGNGFATFDIYEAGTAYHYKISLDGAAYTILPETQRYIEGPGCYYSYVSSGLAYEQKYFNITKHAPDGQVLWSRTIETGETDLEPTIGWADATGVYLVSDYSPQYGPGSQTCRIYISADGVLCD